MQGAEKAERDSGAARALGDGAATVRTVTGVEYEVSPDGSICGRGKAKSEMLSGAMKESDAVPRGQIIGGSRMAIGAGVTVEVVPVESAAERASGVVPAVRAAVTISATNEGSGLGLDEAAEASALPTSESLDEPGAGMTIARGKR